MKKISIIDADGLPYIIGWNYAGTTDKVAVRRAVDTFVRDILTDTKADEYVGMLEPANPDIPCFRHAIAVTQPYKGKRNEKPDWYKYWLPVIRERLLDKWGFYQAPEGMETDDIVCALFKYYGNMDVWSATMCGNDKDLHQMRGLHYNFKTQIFRNFTDAEASYNLFYQVLIGDTTDAIPGLTKCGPKGAESLLTSAGVSSDNYHVAALYAFTNKLGVDKGIQSFYENYMLCKMRDDLDVSLYKPVTFDSDFFDGFGTVDEPDEELPEPTDEAGELFKVHG